MTGKLSRQKRLDQISTAFKTYRQALRDLPSTATPTLNSNYELDMTSVTWLTEPS